jgi:hypothetical protein
MGEKARSKLWGWARVNKEDRTGMGEENVESKIDRDGREKKQGPISDLGDGGETLMDRQGMIKRELRMNVQVFKRE